MSIQSSSVFPHLHLLVSGGNTQLFYCERSIVSKKLIGQTRDDAAGECFDKIGRMIGLPYPAGVSVAKIAGEIDTNILNFPIGMSRNVEYDFSFSGLKTHVRYVIQSSTIKGVAFEKPLTEKEFEILLKPFDDISDMRLRFYKEICISTQHVIVAQLIQKVSSALAKYPCNSLGVSGGVSANMLLRKHMSDLAFSHTQHSLYMPHISLTGDNAVMIGLAGIIKRVYSSL